MKTFRKDINGLRAIAVLSVVIFHFDSSFLAGGFVGVDIFFVISGFLMTSIIFRGIESNNFSLLKFYVARASRIIPALLMLCMTLLAIGAIFFPPDTLKTLGKHVGSSIAFISNIVYFRESGYFDSTSLSKWLLHTWSLSVEWQFYIVYPMLILFLNKLFDIRWIKRLLVIFTVILFCTSYHYSIEDPNYSYYSLVTRSWEMLVGGLVYLFPFEFFKRNGRIYNAFGLSLIVISVFLITKEDYWPGVLSLLPVIGTCLVLQSRRNGSYTTSNQLFQKLGLWSYSIYLWHWPIVVAFYQFDIPSSWNILGIFFSVLLGYFSYRYIESINFKRPENLYSVLKFKPLYVMVFIGITSSIIFLKDGFIQYSYSTYKNIVNTASFSPKRSSCHINKYQEPGLSCEYFGSNVSWATIGDSHVVEISYALAKKLKSKDIGIKQFSFSNCRPAYGEPESFSKCSKWYNDSVDYIIKDDTIKNVVVNHRLTSGLVGGDPSSYPSDSGWKVTDYTKTVLNNFDQLIYALSNSKENVYIYYPIPELPRYVLELISFSNYASGDVNNVIGTSLNWYNSRNEFVINYFNSHKYPKNVHLIKVSPVFCDDVYCFGIKNGKSLYFDDDHPSIYSSEILVDLIKHPDIGE
ncbi:acyltransferase family protein [Vibrio sp. 1567]|uniref:acyltransferase family protein n=1 Tax=Vibrio sp. 1567 TaxID=3074564 RepID=UPI0029654558|nr:acyltransferase family protein [Vibrio sp. 1567]MDW2169808.1 acyltransferase family protein [Vibrio sp. 1567]